MTTDARAALDKACRAVGLDASHADLIRAGENTLYRLSGHVVARVTRNGQLDAAAKEIRVSRWLASLNVPVVETVADLEQPVAVDDRAVTFWRELPAHRFSTHPELATVLRRLHELPPPDFELPALAPFVRQRERIREASVLSADDRDWLLRHLTELEARYTDLPTGRAWCAVHGDAWVGNVVVTGEGPIILDLERFAYGPPEWDLTSIAVDFTTFGHVSAEAWTDFCERYGYDVTTWPGFEILRDARELRKVTFAAQMAEQRSDLTDQATYRLACIQGKHGRRPWNWAGVSSPQPGAGRQSRANQK
jgi:aminoglycoside phosphotransferase (APT) family kinase protein